MTIEEKKKVKYIVIVSMYRVLGHLGQVIV